MWESRREWEQLASGASEPARGTPWHSYSFLLPHHQPGSQAVVIMVGHNAATIMGTALCAAAHQLARTLETPSKKQCLSPQVKTVGS